MRHLWMRVLTPTLVLLVVAGLLCTEIAGQILETGPQRVAALGVLGLFALFIQRQMLTRLEELAGRVERAAAGGRVGDAPAGDDEVTRIWRGVAAMQAELERERDEADHHRDRTEELARALEKFARGKLREADLSFDPERVGAPLARSATALTEVAAQMNQLCERADALARGQIELGELEDRALATRRLAEVDLPRPQDGGELEDRFVALNNQLRRLTVQARVVASDELESPILNERLPGELGDAFGVMVENLRELAERARLIARGDLTSYSEADGDLNTSFNTMVSGLREVVEQITQTAVRISTSAEEILAVLREQELSASHQASGVEETQRTMETLLSSAKKIAESAQTVFKSAERTQANNRTIADRASELKSHTERIGEILESIKEIADRSDLLALNASLEGLRAGEAGKGFTLVANEMRRLAENIKGSVGDIKELLSDIRESALSSVMAIEEGTRLSERTTDSALKITLITQQQQSGTEQVTQSMEELSHLINQGLSGTQQVTTAASELAGLSEDLRLLVDSFRLDEQGRARLDQLKDELERAPRHRRLHAAPARAPAHRRPGRRAQRPPAAEPTNLQSGTSSTGAEGRSPMQETARPGNELRLQRPGAPGSEELNATMRFVGYDQAGQTADLSDLEISSDPGGPTLDMSAVAAELGAATSGSYDDVDDLFDEFEQQRPGTRISSGDSGDSIEETFDAIERDLREPGEADEGDEGDSEGENG